MLTYYFYRNHGNLYLMCNTKVDKVVLENGRAVALRTVPMKVLHPKQQQEKIIKARKQIVISCGTLSTPLVLQRSGIGDPEKLQKAGVKSQVELPGVGLNFQALVSTSRTTTSPSRPIAPSLMSRASTTSSEVTLRFRRGSMTNGTSMAQDLWPPMASRLA